MSPTPPASAPQGAAAASALSPHLHLRVEAVLVPDGDPLLGRVREERAAVAELRFDYPLGAPRDLDEERRARYLLESLGALELACLDQVTVFPGSTADYIIRADGNVHGLCSFTAYAVPQLRALGWRVDLPTDYPYQVVAADVPWYAHVADDEQPGWFNLELGIEVDGRRVNLLPALLDLLQSMPPSAPLERLTPGGRSFALRAGENQYVTVPPERLRILVKVLRELYEEDANGAGAVRFPAARAGSLGQLDAAFAERTIAGAHRGLVWTGATALADRGRGLAGAPAATAVPGGLRATLRPYQEDGLRWLQHLRAHDAGGVLADDMGLGKTLQTIAHLVAEKEAGRLDAPALIAAPTSVVGNWRRELGRFAPHLRVQLVRGAGRRLQWVQAGRCDVALTTYSLLVRDEALLASRRFSMLILDEAQAIKNPRSQAHRAAARINAGHRLCLSGTPVENHLGELWALFDFLNPGLLGDADWFRHRFAVPIERGQNFERLRALREQVAPYVLRRTKEEVARDLPPKTEIVRPVELGGAQRDLYESLRVAGHAEVRRVIARKGLGGSTITILDALMKLRQVCCDPRLVRGEAALGVRESAKYDVLMELVGQQLAQGRRVLVFSQFASMVNLIAQGLTARDVRWVALTGATQASDRQGVVDTFEQRHADVFLITLKAGGTGLNLTSADTVIHYDPWWNPAVQAQATDRAYRIGQQRPVFVYNLIVAGSVEERMLALQRRKRQLADGILAPSSGLPVSAREVEGLFAPMRA
ncbi:MAG TPA: DEAD/DEAH box helicase [Polyangia bacterium]|jgi:superfamily II DNA or RNA helicase|nr:DEAD/DEAH box helicase [Polyangia bacterium]